MDKTYSAFWAGGYATITVAEYNKFQSCLWSVSLDDESRNVDGRKAKSLDHALRNIKRHLGFKPDFQLVQEFLEDDIQESQTWIAKWKKGRIQVEGSDWGGYTWDVFEGEDEDILEYGSSETKEKAFRNCEEVTKQKLKFKLSKE
jgi:hypothetical protein